MQAKTISICAAITLGLACAAVYWPVLGFDFVDVDDPIHLIQNTSYRGLGAEQLAWIFFERHGSAGYDPLAWLSYALDFTLFGLEPTAFHRTNLILFVLCTLAFFGLARRVIAQARVVAAASGDGGMAGGLGSGRDVAMHATVVAACVVTALWALHPLRAESVAWLSERHGLLATLFALLSTSQYLRIRGEAPAHLAATGPWALSLVFYLAALLSKGTVLLLPLCFWVLDASLLQRLHWPPRPGELHDRLLEKIPFLALAFVVGLATLVSRQESGMWTTAGEMGATDRIAQSLFALAYYPWKTIVPTGLSAIQLREEWTVHIGWAYGAAAVAVVATVGLAVAMRRRVPGVLSAGLAYGLLLFPVLGIVQSGPLVVADRYSLLGLVPFFLLLGIGLDRGLAHLGARRGRRPLAVVALLVCMLLASESWATRRQLEHWRDADAFWANVIAQSRDPGLAWLNRALIRQRLGDAAGSDAAFTRAIDAGWDTPVVLGAAAQAAAANGDDERALGLLDAALEESPELVFAWRARAQVLLRLGQPDRALDALRTAVGLHPDDADLRADLAAMQTLLERRAPEARP